ncbi:uridine diphosphate-N-acetylglucosamine-binding protein YvcK [Anaerorhabdus sp.]|uniref:gluconeogenesis factor YvcK family protein n=1 Tax=Anaerorhabdus sp. TaxID=1872524 RepID=UPI002B21E523|nr:uridine diphosphate-N-acetylglucosamine-binding protein YvcK [Anaerorhabdus sp.]MEA4875877.1 uridine diphosphate-N-acetylglucosamine-binding protein YvcK [Anaerorhabdus sp.]
MVNKKVVVLGGGHGQSAILRGIKHIPDIDITAVVTVADDGGSTGRLRQFFNIPAMGDIRGVLIALAESETLLGTLMDYRFETNVDIDNPEQDVLGHNLGNLILVALTESCGNFVEGIEILSKVLNVKGNIVPSTSQVITLFAIMEDGTIVKGETNIPKIENRIRKVFYQEKVRASEKAVQAILDADLIIYGIGSVYTSILPNVIIPEIKDALKESKAKKIYMCNAMTQPGETTSYAMEDHVDALLDHGATIDEVVIAKDKIPSKILNLYEEEGSVPVLSVRDTHSYKIREAELLDFTKNLVRHDSMKIKQLVEELLKNEG